jgi:hypothetical protein
MIEKIIESCARNRFLVFIIVALLMLGGIFALKRIPLDAIPDISDVQVIVYTPWEGRSPDLVEDQVTYPIVTSLISAPKVKTVRGFSDFGFSYVYAIFEEGTDIYWARSRVLEYMMPQGSGGYTSMRWLMKAGNTISPSSAACRTGISAMPWQGWMVLLRWRALVALSSNTRSMSIPTGCLPTGSP